MSSILTNSSAVVALQTLKSINAGLAKTQGEISTGKSVATAKDNAALWSIAKTMEGDQNSAKTIQKNLNVAGETIGTARAGAEAITSLLDDMKQLIISANRSDAGFATLTEQITQKQNQIDATIQGSQANGVNLLKTNGVNGATTYSVLGSLDRDGATVTASSITVESLDLEAFFAANPVAAITDEATAATAITAIEALLTEVKSGAATLGSAGERLSDQSDFVGLLSDSLKLGVSALVDADMEESSARLQALQTQQQLGIQSLSIANQAPSAILSLFRS